MKNYLKNTWSVYVISFVICFILFVFEPISMYSNNINDFWFDYKLLFSINTLAFIGVYLLLIIFFNILYFINKKIFKISVIISFIILLCSYIQGNYFVGNLPVINVDAIDWQSIDNQNYISILIWLIVIITSIILCKKYKMENYIKYSGYVTCAIFIMLTTALIPSLMKEGVLQEKEIIARATFKNINTYSNNKNFIIFLLDTIDSTDFSKALEKNSEFKPAFKDFTYYPDTTSSYMFTRESVTQIMTGNMFKNQKNFLDFFNESMDNSSLINLLEKNNYNINMYTQDYVYNSKKYSRINNFVDYSSAGHDVIKKTFINQELKYILFRYLPFSLKKYSKIESMDFKLAENNMNSEVLYNDDDLIFVNTLYENKELRDYPMFKFIHLSGAHYPFSLLKDLYYSGEGNYYTEVEACVKITNMYIQKLKEIGVYDNSAIIIMSDHGYNFNLDEDEEKLPLGRQNPIFYIKGFNEKNDKMEKSDKKISFVDLQTIYEELISGKKAKEIMNNINNERTRQFYIYQWQKENHIVEYETKDNAWKTNKAYRTGNSFDAK